MENWIYNRNNESDIVISSTIRIARNFKNLPFPNKLNYIRGRENCKVIYSALKEEMKDYKIKLYELWSNSEEINKEYIEKGLISEELLKNSDKASFIINENQTTSIMINEDDHINIQCRTAGLNLEDAFNNAEIIDDKIERNFDYEFNENLGYLTSSPSHLGTGMRAAVIIHLPALTMSGEINNLLKNLNKMGMTIRGVYLDGTKPYGSIYEIYNEVSLGISEEEIIGNLKNIVLNVISEEKKFREILLSKCKYELEDRVYRAYGTLKSAVLLDSKEAIELLSSVRLGVELSLINIDKNKLNELLIVTRDYSLQNYLGRQLEVKEIKYERAKVVKEILI